MTETKAAATAWMQDHLWKIAAAALAFYGTYSAGQATMEARVSELERKNETARDKLRGRFIFMNDATGRINHLCEQDLECRARFAPLRVPE